MFVIEVVSFLYSEFLYNNVQDFLDLIIVRERVRETLKSDDYIPKFSGVDPVMAKITVSGALYLKRRDF